MSYPMSDGMSQDPAEAEVPPPLPVSGKASAKAKAKAKAKASAAEKPQQAPAVPVSQFAAPAKEKPASQFASHPPPPPSQFAQRAPQVSGSAHTPSGAASASGPSGTAAGVSGNGELNTKTDSTTSKEEDRGVVQPPNPRQVIYGELVDPNGPIYGRRKNLHKDGANYDAESSDPCYFRNFDPTQFGVKRITIGDRQLNVYRYQGKSFKMIMPPCFRLGGPGTKAYPHGNLAEDPRKVLQLRAEEAERSKANSRSNATGGNGGGGAAGSSAGKTEKVGPATDPSKAKCQYQMTIECYDETNGVYDPFDERVHPTDLYMEEGKPHPNIAALVDLDMLAYREWLCAYNRAMWPKLLAAGDPNVVALVEKQKSEVQAFQRTMKATNVLDETQMFDMCYGGKTKHQFARKDAQSIMFPDGKERDVRDKGRDAYIEHSLTLFPSELRTTTQEPLASPQMEQMMMIYSHLCNGKRFVINNIPVFGPGGTKDPIKWNDRVRLIVPGSIVRTLLTFSVVNPEAVGSFALRIRQRVLNVQLVKLGSLPADESLNKAPDVTESRLLRNDPEAKERLEKAREMAVLMADEQFPFLTDGKGEESDLNSGGVPLLNAPGPEDGEEEVHEQAPEREPVKARPQKMQPKQNGIVPAANVKAVGQKRAQPAETAVPPPASKKAKASPAAAASAKGHAPAPAPAPSQVHIEELPNDENKENENPISAPELTTQESSESQSQMAEDAAM